MKRLIMATAIVISALALLGCTEDIKHGNVTWYGPDGIHTWEQASEIDVKDNGRFFFKKNGKPIMIYGNIVTEGY